MRRQWDPAWNGAVHMQLVRVGSAHCRADTATPAATGVGEIRGPKLMRGRRRPCEYCNEIFDSGNKLFKHLDECCMRPRPLAGKRARD